MSGQTSSSRGSETRSAGSATKSRRVESRSAVRRFSKRRVIPLGWWPGGLLPLLGLFLLLLWGLLKIAPDIQERTRASVASLLQDSGYSGLDVTTDGQRVIVTGTAVESDIGRIRSIARGATCDAFIAKGLVCPTSVAVNVGEVADTQTHNFTFVRTESGVVLRGDVPSQSVRDQLLSQARSQFENVVDSMLVTGENADVSLEWATDKAWPFLAAVVTGGVAWTDGTLSAWGRTSDAIANDVQQALSSGPFSDRIGEIRLQSSEGVAQCNERFSSVLKGSTINFQPGRAEISPNSRQLLRQLADVANSCPGNLAVEGHTDDVGTAASNRTLSQGRAQAVVDALTQLGVEPARLAARGFGEARPIRTNASSAGRAQNRRIEIKVAALN